MPERNILRLTSTQFYEGGRMVHRYYARIHQETARAFNLVGESDDEEYLLGTVNGLLDSLGNLITIVHDEQRFKTYSYQSTGMGKQHGVLLPDKLLHDYGLRERECLDITFTEIQRPASVGGRIPIFSKILRYGELSIQPKGLPSEVRAQLPEVLIERQFSDPFFSALVLELNLAYGFGLKRSTLVLFRNLLENLLVELLRGKLGMSGVDSFFDQSRGRFLDLSVLITNLDANLVDFKPYTTALDEGFVQRLGKYRERANATAHHLEAEPEQIFFQQNKEDMNFICNALSVTAEKITGRNL